MILSDDVTHSESARHCHKEFGHDLWAATGEKLRRSNVTCDLVLKEDERYYGSARFCTQNRLGQRFKSVCHRDYELVARLRLR